MWCAGRFDFNLWVLRPRFAKLTHRQDTEDMPLKECTYLELFVFLLALFMNFLCFLFHAVTLDTRPPRWIFTSVWGIYALKSISVIVTSISIFATGEICMCVRTSLRVVGSFFFLSFLLLHFIHWSATFSVGVPNHLQSLLLSHQDPERRTGAHLPPPFWRKRSSRTFFDFQLVWTSKELYLYFWSWRAPPYSFLSFNISF